MAKIIGKIKKAKKTKPTKTLLHEVWTVSDGKYDIEIIIEQAHIQIVTPEGKEFVFCSNNSPETIKRWHAINKLLELAIEFAKERREKAFV